MDQVIHDLIMYTSDFLCPWILFGNPKQGFLTVSPQPPTPHIYPETVLLLRLCSNFCLKIYLFLISAMSISSISEVFEYEHFQSVETNKQSFPKKPINSQESSSFTCNQNIMVHVLKPYANFLLGGLTIRAC
jgi:hypothetical protein